MRELEEFEKILAEAKEEQDELTYAGAESPSEYGGVEYVSVDDLYDSMIGDIAAGFILQGDSEKTAKNKVDKAIKTLIKEKAIEAYPEKLGDNAKLMWINYAKPIIRSHLVLVGELIL